MHGYDEWANEHVLCCCEQISTDQFTQKDDTPWGSIRNQLVHQFGVHRSWLSWADGSMSGEEAYALQTELSDYQGIDAVRSLWSEVRTQNLAFLERVDDDTLHSVLRVEWPGYQFAVPTWKIMLHIAQHSMQHRTEAAMSLTRLGASPGDIDYLFYALEQG